MNFHSLLEDYVLKKRNIMRYHAPSERPAHVLVMPMRAFDISSLKTSDEKLLSHLKKRQGDSAWVFFFCNDGLNTLGYGFLHAPRQEEWNDSLPTLPGEARISSTFVYPDFRGRGVRAEIFKAQYFYAQENNLTLWSVIEERNVSSMRAASKTGYVGRENYLLKFFGRNVLSVLTNPFQVFLMYPSRRVRR